MMDQVLNARATDSSWRGLYKIGGAAALIAGAVFRRNLGVEIAIFSVQKQPATVIDWFTLLQSNRLLGLAYLNIFDIVNYALVGLMFLALYAVLGIVNKSQMAIAATLGFLGIAVNFASNTAFSLLSLSDQYVAATTLAERQLLMAAGQAMLALNRFSSSGAHPGSGGYLSLFLIATAGLMSSAVLLRSNVFGRAAAYVGILANGLDLAYCTAIAFAPSAAGEQLALLFIPTAGFFFLVWHILVGWRLLQLGRLGEKPLSNPK